MYRGSSNKPLSAADLQRRKDFTKTTSLLRTAIDSLMPPGGARPLPPRAGSLRSLTFLNIIPNYKPKVHYWTNTQFKILGWPPSTKASRRHLLDFASASGFAATGDVNGSQAATDDGASPATDPGGGIVADAITAVASAGGSTSLVLNGSLGCSPLSGDMLDCASIPTFADGDDAALDALTSASDISFLTDAPDPQSDVAYSLDGGLASGADDEVPVTAPDPTEDIDAETAAFAAADTSAAPSPPQDALPSGDVNGNDPNPFNDTASTAAGGAPPGAARR